MRAIKNLSDVQIVLKQLLDWQSSFPNGQIDFKKNQIVNAGLAVNPNDYVVFSQLPVVPSVQPPPVQHYSMVWNFSQASNGMKFSPFIGSSERAGKCVWVKCACSVPPSGGAFEFNILRNGVAVLNGNVSLGSGNAGPVTSSVWVTNLAKVGNNDVWVPNVINAHGASFGTIQVYVERTAS